MSDNGSGKYRVRVRFAKYGVMKYVGHLDTMRFFQKAIRRAEIPVAYSKGFHPHQLLSFAQPLGVGVSSEGEYLDIELEDYVRPDAAIASLNEQMVSGVFIIDFKYLKDNAKKAMAAVTAASYLVSLSYRGEDTEAFNSINWEDAIRKFYTDSDSIQITKETKKGQRTLDLKPLVYNFTCLKEDHVTEYLKYIAAEDISSDSENEKWFYTALSSGSTDNIKPQLLFSHFLGSIGFDMDAARLAITRLNLFRDDGKGGHCPLL